MQVIRYFHNLGLIRLSKVQIICRLHLDFVNILEVSRCYVRPMGNWHLLGGKQCGLVCFTQTVSLVLMN